MIDLFFNHGFILEMIIATGLFVYSLKFRRFGLLKIIIVLILLFLISILWDKWIDKTPFIQIFKYTVLFLGFTSGVMFCFQESFWGSLFYLISAYAVQHSAYKIGSMVQWLLKDYINSAQSSIIYVVVIMIVFFGSYFLFSRRIKRETDFNTQNQEITILTIVLIIFTTMFQFIFLEHQDNLDWVMYVMFSMYDLLCCMFVLLIQFGMLKSEKLQQEYEIIEHLMYRQRMQMSISKEEINLINIKYHDLKHYLMHFGKDLSKNNREELEQAISIYGTSLKTGNEALDITLAEKSLICEKNKIILNCMADGEQLSFMHLTDVYSLFWNAFYPPRELFLWQS